LKILMLVWDFHGGGAERVSVVLANALSKRGHEVFFVASRETGPNRSLVDPDVPVIVPKAHSALASLFSLVRIIRERRPDVVMAHQTTRNVMGIAAHYLAPRRSERIVVGVEYSPIDMRIRLWKRIARRRLQLFAARLLYPLAEAIVSCSENTAVALNRFLRPFRANSVVLPDPVIYDGMVERSHEEPQHPWLRDKKTPVIVALGRLELQKNYPLLIDAFAELARTRDVRLIIFGEGGLRDEIAARIAASGLQDRIDMPGYTQNPFAVLQTADVFVMSSLWEGLPTVAIEALFFGVPIVSTDNSTGIREILQDGRFGVLVPIGDPTALAQALARALDQPVDLQAMRDHAEQFRDSRVAEIYETFLSKLLKGKKATIISTSSSPIT
jgi:glycosyltransferase involved in cell wall biosynthesis